MSFEVEAAKRHGAQPIPIFTLYLEGGEEYEVPWYDIRNAGTLLWSKEVDFSGLNSSDHTLTLINTSGKYTPGHHNFVFADDPQYYYRRRLKIELGYRLPGTSQIFKELLYRGVIQEWGPTEFPEPDDGEVPTVEIYTQDLVSSLLDQTILGRPDAQGTPQPLVYGQIMADAGQVADANPDTPDRSAFFEAGGVTGADAFDSLSEAGGGAVAIDAANFYDGAYCARAAVSGANQTACGNLALSAASDLIQVQFRLRLAAMPASPVAANCKFMQILDEAGAEVAYLEVRDSFEVRIHAKKIDGWSQVDTGWWLNSYLDTYCLVSVVICKLPRFVKIFVENSEIFNWEPEYAPVGNYKTLVAGFQIGATAETWTGFIDNVKVWPSFYRYLYQLPGGEPYQSLDGVWVEGAVVNYNAAGFASKQARIRYNRKHWLTKRYGQGRAPNAELVTKYPVLGAVDFGVDVQSGVFILATKNTTNHPVDVLTALFTEAGLAALLDAASFAAAKAATTFYRVGCIFEDVSALDAVMEIAGKCLYSLCLQIPVRLLAYTGAPPASAGTLTDADFYSLSSTDLPREIVNKMTTKFGWFEHDDRSKVDREDAASIALVGEKLSEISLEWGEAVATNLRLMAETVTDLLLTRLSKAPRKVEGEARLNLATLLLGQTWTLDSASLGRPPEDYELMELEVDLQEWRTRLTLYSVDIPLTAGGGWFRDRFLEDPFFG